MGKDYSILLLSALFSTNTSYRIETRYWQQELAREEYLRQEREDRREAREKRKEEKKLRQLQRELEAANRREKTLNSLPHGGPTKGGIIQVLPLNDVAGNKSPRKVDEVSVVSSASGFVSPRKSSRPGSRIGGILNRISGAKRVMSQERLMEH